MRGRCCTRCALQELLKMENCLFIFLLPKHYVCQHLSTNMLKNRFLFMFQKRLWSQL